jgi:hypothetical protein
MKNSSDCMEKYLKILIITQICIFRTSEYKYKTSRRTTSMVSVFSLSVVDHTFELQLDKTQDNESGIYCFSVNHAVIKSQDNVSEWSDMSIHELLFIFQQKEVTFP